MIDNYENLTLGRYMRINAVLDEGGEEIDQQVQILAILDDKTPDDILLLPLTDYARMAAQSAFLRVPCKPTPITSGWRYGNLVPTEDFRKINTAQYIDFQTFSKQFPATLPELLSCFLVPEGKAYNDGYDVAEVQNKVRELPLPVALGLSAFFLERFSASIEDSITSLRGAAMKAKGKQRKEMLAKLTEVEALLRTAGAGWQM